MLKRILAATLCSALIVAVAAPVSARAQDTKTAPSTTTTKKKGASAGQTAARQRQKQCGAEWKQAKADGKVEKGMKWPQYWSQCNTRLKAKGA
jgi:Flp pilus assembly protein TadD